MSGWIWLVYSLRALESLASRALSTNPLIVGGSESPLTEVIIYFNLVDTSDESSFLNFFNPSNSWFIFVSSPWVNNLKVISLPE